MRRNQDARALPAPLEGAAVRRVGHDVTVVAHIAPHRAPLDVFRALGVEHLYSGSIRADQFGFEDSLLQLVHEWLGQLRDVPHAIRQGGHRDPRSATGVNTIEPMKRNMIHVLAHHHMS